MACPDRRSRQLSSIGSPLPARGGFGAVIHDLAFHLLQSSLVHINTLLLQRVLAEPACSKELSDEDRRGLTALFWSNVNPYGTFHLDMDRRLDLAPLTFPRPRQTVDGVARAARITLR
ncbi:Tn3 family transposase [Streptomyces sp. NPDC056704]|uniref:Tn3 family transposase n=1 Tax=Streptomyces sp. NPDC056704 TaxID=3345917 RepID=UPI00369D728E